MAFITVFENLKFSKKANMYELDYKLGSVVAKHMTLKYKQYQVKESKNQTQ